MPRRKIKLYTFQQGSSVYHEGLHYVIVQIVNLEFVLVQNLSTSEIKRVKITELKFTAPGTETAKSSLLDAIADEDWQVAQQRMEIIQPLVHREGRTKADVEEVAKKYDLHINSIYKWLRLYEPNSLLSSLTPKTRSDSGTTKLTAEVEAIISACIEEEYLTKQKKSIASLYMEIKRQCAQAKLPKPHANTVRNRVLKISEQVKIRKRFGNKKADDMFSVSLGEFPHAEYPLAVIQIDHTLIDLILVDDEYRLPIGRPWITLAVDVHSRMVVGFYISFDPPSATSVGLCLSHAFLPKDNWLVEHEIASSWPVWGLPRTIHADNAKEFRGNMLQTVCQEYEITLEWRPVARPKYGAHIERLLGTFAKKIHELPGTTWSNTKQREGYDSEKESALTLSEFERWLAILITEVYHHRNHEGINSTPIKRFEEGILGTKTTKGVGLPKRIEDEHTLKLNLLPFVERTVQDYGIQIDNIFYFHDVLRVWVNSKVEGRSKLKRKFICRYDLRDLSTIWFFDPELKTYYPIPYRNTSHPVMSFWELKAITNKLKADGKTDIDEDMIFAALEKMREIETTAVKKTKKMRRSIQRRKSSQSKASTYLDRGKSKQTQPEPQNAIPVTSSMDDEMDDEFDDIQPFDELVEVRRNV